MTKKFNSEWKEILRYGKAKNEWKRIQEEKKKGVKNPYRHFIQNIEKYKDIQKITNVDKGEDDAIQEREDKD